MNMNFSPKIVDSISSFVTFYVKNNRRQKWNIL